MGAAVNGYEYYEGTPCASCVHMCWDHQLDEPGGICTKKLPNRYGAMKPGTKKCLKNGFKFYREDGWKAEKVTAWEKKNGVLLPENAAPAQ